MSIIFTTTERLKAEGWQDPDDVRKKTNEFVGVIRRWKNDYKSMKERMQARIDDSCDAIDRIVDKLDEANTKLRAKEETNGLLTEEMRQLQDLLVQAQDEIERLKEADPMAHAASTYLTIASLENSGEDIGTQVGVDWTVRFDHETGTIVSPTPDNSVIPLDWGTWIEHKTSKEDAAKIEAAVLHLAKDRLNKTSTVPLSGSVDAYVCKLATTFDDGITVEY